MKIWLLDPKDGTHSVSLTILVVSFVALIAAGALQMLGKVPTVSVFPEMFYSATALYFGRRLNINGKAYSSDDTQKGV